MYCRNCGVQLGEKDKTCTKCDFVRGFGADYCPDCGAKTEARARKCPDCGGTLFILRNTKPRSRIAAALMAFFIGMFGIHNFYLGYMRKGLLQVIVSVVGLIIVFAFGTLFTIGAPVVMALWGIIEGYQLITGAIRVGSVFTWKE